MRTGRSVLSIGRATLRTARIMASSPGITNLRRSPHRLMFFIGWLNLLLSMAWWAAWLISARWGLLSMPHPEPYAGRLHAFLMQYQVLPSFFFGFLLTVFPRWLGEPDLDRRAAWPVGAGLFGSQILTIAGALGWRPAIIDRKSTRLNSSH